MNWRLRAAALSIVAVFAAALGWVPFQKTYSPLATPELAEERDDGGEAQKVPVCFSTALSRISAEHGLSPKLVQAIIQVESEGNPKAVSRKGAMGLMQLMPSVLEAYQVKDPFDPLANVEAGVRHLKYLLREFSGNLSLALAAYNAGPGTVRKYGGIPPFPETHKYLFRVLREYQGEGNDPEANRQAAKIKRELAAKGPENPSVKSSPELFASLSASPETSPDPSAQ
jgi:soluble lytic murein transglycosylase-like protein